MSLWAKIKAAWAARRLVNIVNGWSRGWKTWSFWAVTIGQILTLLAATKGLLPPQAQTITVAILTALYNLARGQEKMNETGTRPVLQTTEFWMAVAGQAQTAILDIQRGGIDNTWVAATVGVLGAVLANRKMANVSPQ